MGMNVNLTPQLEEMVRSKVASGLYTSASEVVREALRLMSEQDRLRAARLEQLRDDILQGLDSGPSSTWSVEEATSAGSQGQPMSRLTIDVTAQQHQALKALAALEGKSIKHYVLERLFPADEQTAMQELKSLLQSRLAAAERAEVSPWSAAEIAEQTLREMGTE